MGREEVAGTPADCSPDRMGYDLTVYTFDLQHRAERVAQLQPDELRRKAVRAASEKDAGELWSIVESYLVTRGARGSRVSRHTLQSYRQGLQVLLAFCDTVSPTLGAALKAWVAMTPQVGERVFAVTTWRAIEISLSKLRVEAGVEYGRKHVHGLRHSAGTRVYVETKDLLEVRDHLQHRDITSSEIYVEYARKGKPKVNRDW